MTLRSKLTLMFLGALQVTFLTAVGTFWAVQSWQIVSDDLTLIHDQNRRLERAVRLVAAPTSAQRAAAARRPQAPPAKPLQALRQHAQTLDEVQRIEALASALEAR